MGGIPTELRIVINTMARKALAELQRVEQMLLRIRRGRADRPILTHSVHQTAFTQLASLRSLIEQIRSQNTGRPPPINTAVSQKAFTEVAALRAQIAQMHAAAASGAATSGAAASKSATDVGKAAAVGAAAAGTMAQGSKESSRAIKQTGSDMQATSGFMSRFMAAQNSRLRAFGSEVQWTGRQMQHHLTMPFVLMAAFSGKTWFDQEDIMTQVVKVYGDASQSASELENEIESLRDVATQLSEVYGRNREEVLQVAEAWAVAGSSGIALAESMNLTMQASVLGSMDSIKASEMLIAIQAQYGVSTEGLTKILAQLNYASNNTALTIEQLGMGFQRAASVARSSGMDAGNLALMIASIAPAAGTAQQAGNGLRMIMTRVQSQTSDTTRVIEYMNEQLGDSMISMKEFYGLPMEEKLFHLADGYDKLGAAQRTQAASMIAGAHQVGRMEILLRELNNQQGYFRKNIEDVQDDAEVARVMFQELTKNLTSDPRRIQQAWQGFRNAMAEVFVPLIPIVTYFINAIGDVAKGFTNLNPSIQKLIVGIGLVLALIGPIIVAMGVVALTAVQLGPLFLGIGAILYWLTAGPFVALFKGLRNAVVGLMATGTAAENLGPKMGLLNRIFGSVAQGAASLIGGPLRKLSAYAFGDFMGLGKLPGIVSKRMSSITTGLVGWYQKQTAINSANSVVNAAIAAKEWTSRQLIEARGWAAKNAITAKGWIAERLIALRNIPATITDETKGWAARRILAERGWAARHGIESRGWLLNRTMVARGWIENNLLAARGWANRHVVNIKNAAAERAQTAATWAANARIQRDGTIVQLAGLQAHWNARTRINAVGHASEVSLENRGWIARNVAHARGWVTRHVTTAKGWLFDRAVNRAGAIQSAATEREGWAARLASNAAGWVLQLAQNSGFWKLRNVQHMGGVMNTVLVERLASKRLLTEGQIRETALLMQLNQGWAARIGATISGWGTSIAMEVRGWAGRLKAAFAGSSALVAFSRKHEGIYNRGIILGSIDSAAIETGRWLKRVGIAVKGGAALAATTARAEAARLGTQTVAEAKSIGLASGSILKRIAVMAIGQKRMWTLEAKASAMRYAVQRAGGLKQLAAMKASQALMLVTSASGWKKILAVAFTSVGSLVKGVGAGMMAIVGAIGWPITLAIAAAIAIFFLFGDKIRDVVEGIKGYFQNLPEGVRQGLQPIVNLWNNVVNGIASVWNRLPRVIQAPLEAVWSMIQSAMNGIRKLLSFMNPFQRHSPSLVDNVNAGMDVIGSKFQSTANSVQGHVNSMSAAVAGLRGTFAQLDAMNAANQRAQNIETIRTAGVGDVGAQIAAYEQVESQLASLRNQLGPLNQRIAQQEQVVNRAAAAVQRAEANIDSMNQALDQMQAHADAVSASLDAARERLDHFSNATIAGMGAVDDAMFENEMAQKSLQLQIAQLEDAAGVATGGASDHFAKLQGDIENLSGQRMELHFAGAGSDITDVYKGMESQLRDEQLNIGGVGIDSGPGAEIVKLQKQLDELDRQATIMDLEKSLKFDPLTRQIEQMTSTSKEIPFDQIVSGIRSNQAEVNSLERSYESATKAVEEQEAAISQAEAARDILTARHSEQDEALQALRDSYMSVEESIREGEGALQDMTSSAEEAIRRVEELQRANEAAASGGAGGRGRAGGTGGAGGSGGAESMSPRFSAFMEAEGAAEFGDPGEGFTVGRNMDFGTDQSALMDEFDPLEGMPDVAELVGEFDMLSPFKNAWQKVVDWWNNTVFPMKNPLGDMLGGIGESVNVNLGGENMTVMENFSGWWDKLVGIWNDWVWPALQFIGEAIKNTLTPAIENLRNVFANDLAPILQRVGERFQEMWPHIKELFKALWDIGKWILAFFIGKALLKLIAIFTVVWAVITVGINMISHMLAPLLSWIGDMIESIVLIVQGVIRVISGAINIVMGIIKTIIGAIKGMFTGDWSMALAGLDQLWQGVKDFVMGIVDIFHGLLRAIVSTIVNGARLVWGAIWGLVEGVIDFFKGLYNTIVGNSIIPDMVNAIVDWFISLPGKVFTWVSQLVTGVIEFFWNLITTVVGAVAGFIVSIVSFYVDLYTQVIKWVIDLVTGVIKWFVDLVTTVVRNVSDFVASVINFYKDLFNKVVQIVLDLRDSVVEKAKELADNFVKNIIAIKDKVLGFFRNAKDWLVDAGKNIIQGLIDGAGKLLSKLGELFLDKVPGFIKEPFKKALGIESPSKVFAGYGENIVEGLIVGVEDKTGDLESSMQTMADVASAVEIAAPVMLAAATVDVPAMPDVPMIDAPAAVAAPDMEVPDFSAPDMDALLASFNEFDAQYQVSVDGHTAGVEAEHAAMFANLDAQFQTWSAGSLAAYANYTLAVGTILSAFAQSATALYVNLWNTLASTTASGANNISSVLSSGTNAWLSLLTAFINALLTAWTNLINQLASLLTTGANNITSIWQSLANNFNKIFSDGIKPVFDAFLPMLQTLEGWFRSTVDNIGAIWGEVEPKTKDPARVVINDVYDTGLRGAWNNFNEFLDLPELPSYRAAFASGGVLPGYTPGRDVHRFVSPTGGMLDLSGGEAIMRPEFTRAIGTSGVDRLNKIAAQGGVSGLGRAFEHMSLGRYAAGGVLPYIGGFNPGGVIYGGGYGGLTPITRTHAEWVGRHFPNMFTLTSALRFTDTGYHSTGRATDWQATDGHFATQMPTPYSKAMARAMHATFPNAAELIHWPLDGWQNIWHGRPHNYDAGTNAQHANHIHFATQGPISGGIALGSFEGGITPLDWSEYISNKFEEELGAVADSAPDIGGGIGEWIPAAIEKSMEAATFLADHAEEYFAAMMDPAGPAVERWRPLAMQALARHGYDPDQYIEAMLQQIDIESSGDPKALNLWDSNAIAGIPSGGLLQVIEPTYRRVRNAYPEAFEGLPDDRWHPLTNLTAGVGAVRMDWGGPGGRWPTTAGYDEGGLMPPTPGGFGTYYNHTGETEAVLTKPQWDNIYRAADAATELSYEDIVRAFKSGLSSNEFENGLDKGIIRKVDPRWKELELAVFDAAELIAVASDENTETWVDHFNRIGGEVKDFFDKASEFMFSVQETAEFLASDEFWDKVKENSGESWGKAEEALDFFHSKFAGYSFIEEREALAAAVDGAVGQAAAVTVAAIEDSNEAEDEREEERKKREEEKEQREKTDAEKAAARESSLFNVLNGLIDQRLKQVNESLARIGSTDIFNLGNTIEREIGTLTGIADETFGSIDAMHGLAGNIGEAVHKLVFENFNLTGAVESIRKSAGPDGQIPQILQGVFEVLDSEDGRAMIHQLEEHGRIVAQAIGQTLAELDFGKYYAPLVNKLADWMEEFPRYQAQYASNTTTGFANSLDSIMTRPLETMANLLGGIYNTFLDIAPTLLRGVSGIGSSLSSFAGNNSAAMAAIVTAVVTGDPLGLIPHIPQLLALAVELIPQIIDVIINIVPTLVRSIIDLFNNFMPWSNQGYDTAEEALKASIAMSKKIDDSDRFFNSGGGSGGGNDPQTWRPEGASGNQQNFYGDLSFPNVTSEDDAKGFIENLSRL